MLSIIAQLAVFVILAMNLPLSQVGQFALVSGVWVLSRALGPLGWDLLIMREMSRLSQGNDVGYYRSLAMKAVAVSAIPTAAVLAAMTLWITNPSGGEEWLTSGSIVLGGTLWAAVGPIISALRGLGRPQIAQLIDSLLLQVLPAFGISVCAMFGLTSLHGAIFSYSISAIAATMVGSVALVRVLNSAMLEAHASTDRPRFFQLQVVALRLWVGQLATALSNRLSTLLTAPLAGLSAVALVETGLRGQLVSSTISWAIGVIASPRYATEGDSARSLRTLSAAIGAISVASGVFLVAVALLGPVLLPLLGAAYASAYVPLLLMCLAAFTESIASACGYFFGMTGRENQNAIGSVIQLCVLIGAAIALVPSLGAAGTGVAVLSASAMRSAYALFALGKMGLLSVASPVRAMRALIGR